MSEEQYYTLTSKQLCDAAAAIITGLEHTGSVLIEHDHALGRTTLKNRLWAERVEQDIKEMQSALGALPKI